MKNSSLLLVLIAALLFQWSCREEEHPNPEFEDMIKMTIYDYMVEKKDTFSSFLAIMEKGGLDLTMSAYNPNATDGKFQYTLFLPTNEAVDKFINEHPQYNSLSDLLNDEVYVRALSRYHVLNMGIITNDFPFGALPELTLSGDQLTVSFIIESDTSYYKINNQAAIILPNIEASNGYVHVMETMLTPVTFTTYGWLAQNPGYSIFKAALDATGLRDTLNINLKTDTRRLRPHTLLVEHDSIFHRRNIRSFEDLANHISPGSTNYTSKSNLLYNFMAYHVLEGSLFLDDFEGVASNYNTYSDIPLSVNGIGIDIAINKGFMVFDSIFHANGDTTLIDYVGVLYDASNMITQSGSVHFINQIMRQFSPAPAIRNYEFWEESLFSELRREAGSYEIEDPSLLSRITWSGADLFFVKSEDADDPAWNQDYLFLNGDFTISYTMPKIIQGKYKVFLGAHAYSEENALVEVYLDNKKIGGLVDLTTGGSSSNPYARKEIGTVEFQRYEDHTIRIVSLIPGAFMWDYVRFEPVK
ncbi:MAG: fasciclin domain-containing protein [Prolixibacteraceae bacterium]|jgi:uncharacterized surface protein with fasciclin (FAS1) repeats|nr:fasciclin domain-containing protein [Prolixibacteraceae bacterium]NLX28509.1 hypothetical protein [Bacteroidales bacterium]HPJ78142.1 fasciclin domain-containing protein [Prolixibacteraceae bacterium]HRV87915.1 fasciclin domain-containing protein [Prolixibacteraceae bacterium]